MLYTDVRKRCYMDMLYRDTTTVVLCRAVIQRYD